MDCLRLLSSRWCVGISPDRSKLEIQVLVASRSHLSSLSGTQSLQLLRLFAAHADREPAPEVHDADGIAFNHLPVWFHCGWQP
jgi:hypothetical protein